MDDEGVGDLRGKRGILGILIGIGILGASGCGSAPVAEVEAGTRTEGAGVVSKVYMDREISAASLMRVYEALGRPASGRVAVKLHMGEVGNTNYLSPELLRDLVTAVDGTFVDGNTYYGGRRASTAAHLEVAKEHGFTYAPVDILDADGEVKLPIDGGKRLEEAIVGSHYGDYDFIVAVAHFKGHSMAGYGGAFKNLAIGMSSVNGKAKIHKSWIPGQFTSFGKPFLEKIAEVGKGIMDDCGDRIVYVNVMNNLSVDCDCVPSAAHPQMGDVGVLASLDPVALDQACIDLVYAAPEAERKHLVDRIESKNGAYLLEYAEGLGLGSRRYEIEMVGE